MSTAREETAAARERLMRAAVEAHENFINGTKELKRLRQEAFKRAVYSRLITRKELGQKVDMAERTISHVMNGR